MVEISGRGLRLALPVDVSPGVAVRVDLGDSLLLGEVCHHASTPQGFIVGLVLEHSLTGLHQLENLRRTLLESATESAPGSREDREISKVL